MKDARAGRQFGKPAGMDRDQMREFLRKWSAGELEGQYVESTVDLSDPLPGKEG